MLAAVHGLHCLLLNREKNVFLYRKRECQTKNYKKKHRPKVIGDNNFVALTGKAGFLILVLFCKLLKMYRSYMYLSLTYGSVFCLVSRRCQYLTDLP